MATNPPSNGSTQGPVKVLDVQIAQRWRERMAAFALAIHQAGDALGTDEPTTGFECIDRSIALACRLAAESVKRMEQVCDHINLHLRNPDEPDMVALIKQRLRGALAEAGLNVEEIVLDEQGGEVSAVAAVREDLTVPKAMRDVLAARRSLSHKRTQD